MGIMNDDFDLVNLQPNKVSKNLDSYTSMLYAPSKLGKTTFAYNMFKEEGLIVGFEIGWKGISGAMAIPMKKWSDCSKLTRKLKDEKVKEKYKVLIIDTIDLMYEACKKHVLQINNADKLSSIKYGQGYGDIDDLIRDQLLEWQRLGYSLFFISHSIPKEEEVMMVDGTKETIEKYIPTLNKRCFNIVNKFVDNIFFGNIVVDEEGNSHRVLFTRETLSYKAGTRFAYLEEMLPLDADKVKEAISRAIDKEELTTDEKSEIVAFEIDEKTFEEVKEEITNLVMGKFYESDNMHHVTNIVEGVLGTGMTVNEATEKQKDALEIVLMQLEDKADELKL